ncbi:MAG: hypothetical protein NE327_14735 [Lentisphaeraceae bacterium]|nr:hypothetical protein [Lentisphaeraceae bacterium]
MKEISRDEFLKLTKSATVLEKDGHGEKVLLLPGEKICKLFRCKRTISTAKFYPYVQRFADNAAKLKEIGFTSVDVEDVYRVQGMSRDAVFYKLLEGETLRKVYSASEDPEKLTEKFIAYVNELHNKGVYFRSLHFGNVLVLPDGNFGLIDVSDMKISSKPLGVLKRVRNFRAILRYEEDRQYIKNYGVKKFLDRYISVADLSEGMFYTVLKMQKKHPAVELLN